MPQLQTGLLFHDPERSFVGYTTVGTYWSNTVTLVDNEGVEVHRWDLPGRLGSMAYLLPGGNLLCSVKVDVESDVTLWTARGGRMLELDWDGNIVWEYTDDTQHHDLRRLPDGNTIYIGWRALPPEFAASVPGGVPGSEHDGFIFEDYFRIVSPEGETVWEWSMSELDPANYPIAHGVDRGEFGHGNTVCPLADGTFLVNFRNLDLIAILDPESRSFVWEARDPRWGRPHDPQPVDDGKRIMLFANGAVDKPKPQRSAVVEIDAVTGEEVWRWEAGLPWTFYSHVMGGVQRLPNGNTLVCQSVAGRIFEIDKETEEIVWDYVNPDFSSDMVTARELANCVFRAFRYSPDSIELAGTPLGAKS